MPRNANEGGALMNGIDNQTPVAAAGRVIGGGVVALLHAEPALHVDLEKAKAELAAVRAQGVKPTRDCAGEATALAR